MKKMLIVACGWTLAVSMAQAVETASDRQSPLG